MGFWLVRYVGGNDLNLMAFASNLYDFDGAYPL